MPLVPPRHVSGHTDVTHEREWIFIAIFAFTLSLPAQ